MAPRKVVLKQRTLQGLSSMRNSLQGYAGHDGGPNQIGHWAVDVGEGSNVTRFELYSREGKSWGVGGSSTLSVSRTTEDDASFAVHDHANITRGVTSLCDVEIQRRAQAIIDTKPSYDLFFNNCQRFSVLLCNDILDAPGMYLKVVSSIHRAFSKIGF